MSEAVKQTTDYEKKTKKKKSKKLLIFLLILLLLFTLSFVTVRFNLFGSKNVVDNLLKKVPFIETAKDKSEKDKLINSLQNEISNLKSNITKLNSTVKEKDTKISELTKQIESLTNELAKKNKEQEDRQNKLKNYANYLTSMDSKKAAKIIESLISSDAKMAQDIFSLIPTENASEILSNISSDKSIILLGVSNNSKTNSVNTETITKIYSVMDDSIAASIFESMITNKNTATVVSILKSLDTKKISSILSKMNPTNAAQITKLMQQ